MLTTVAAAIGETRFVSTGWSAACWSADESLGVLVDAVDDGVAGVPL